MVAVSDCAVPCVDKRNDFLCHHFLIGVGAVLGAVRDAAAHDDDHRLGLALGNEVVEDDVGEALIDPAGLILAAAVLEVEDGEALVAVHLVLRRSIDEQCAVLVACLGIELHRAYGTVRDVGTRGVERCSLRLIVLHQKM